MLSRLRMSFIAPLLVLGPLSPAWAEDGPAGAAPLSWGLGQQGFYLGTLESGFQLRIRGVLQADERFFLDAATPALVDTFLIRRARPIIEGTVAEVVDFRLMPEFGQGKAQILEAYLDYRFRPWLALRAGKFKSPFGLERLQQEVALLFMERGLSSNLVPDRDIGLVLHGDVGRGLVQYDLGVLDGTADNSNLDGDSDSAKDVVIRVFAHPFQRTCLQPLRAFGVGGAATWGREFGNTTASQLPAYVSDGQQVIFAYLADPKNPTNTVFAHGEHLRFSPQANWYFDRFGVYGEWVWASQGVQKGSQLATVIHRGWQVAGSVVLIGGAPSYEGVIPTQPLNVHAGTYGALELAARYGELRLDKDALAGLADPTQSVSDARGWAVGLNWFLSRNAKVSVDFERTVFTGGASSGDRQPENDLFTRVQVSF